MRGPIDGMTVLHHRPLSWFYLRMYAYELRVTATSTRTQHNGVCVFFPLSPIPLVTSVLGRPCALVTSVTSVPCHVRRFGPFSHFGHFGFMRDLLSSVTSVTLVTSVFAFGFASPLVFWRWAFGHFGFCLGSLRYFCRPFGFCLQSLRFLSELPVFAPFPSVTSVSLRSPFGFCSNPFGSREPK